MEHYLEVFLEHSFISLKYLYTYTEGYPVL